MPFHKIQTDFEGLFLLKPKVFPDNRGHFFELYSEQKLYDIGFEETFVQDNVSLSQANTIRGLHFQVPPFAQGKLVTVLYGKALDVVVDLRKNQPTYGKVYQVELDYQNPLLFYIPPGFAHGFAVYSHECVFYYKCTNYYHKPSEQGLPWNDPAFNINWRIDKPILSE
ncbi:MAG: dTDP-4-dehydrorhamnose 3,5-epimerase, partial [Bacteroidia bacterium]|nr:dTDP-4-dehydrorhamnose 3,5-epimerase [Bacteroidia bacterium]